MVVFFIHLSSFILIVVIYRRSIHMRMLPSLALRATLSVFLVLVLVTDSFLVPSLVPKRSLATGSWSSRSTTTTTNLLSIQEGSSSSSREDEDSMRNSFRRRLAFLSIKNLLSSKASKHFLAALVLVVSFWRTPTAPANAALNNARGPLAAIKNQSAKRIIVPSRDTKTPTSKSSLKPLVVIATSSGVAFSVVGRVRRRRTGKNEVMGHPGEDESSSSSEQLSPSEELPDLKEEESLPLGEANSSTPLVEQIVDTEPLIEEEVNEVEEPVKPRGGETVGTSHSGETVPSTTIFEDRSNENESLKENQELGGTFAGTSDAAEEASEKHDSSELTIEKESKSLREESINEMDHAAQDQNSIEARRRQPKVKNEEAKLATKYGQIKDISERAYQILVDLGMV